jgi:hypothetical protein
MIGNFVTLLKENAFRVRSTRVIKEMDTWIWKNGRPDHMDGCHDDSLTCLAMGLFVIQFYIIKNDKDRSKQKVMLTSFRVNNLGQSYGGTDIYNKPISQPHPMPFYSTKSAQKREEQLKYAMLMLSGYMKK